MPTVIVSLLCLGLERSVSDDENASVTGARTKIDRNKFSLVFKAEGEQTKQENLKEKQTPGKLLSISVSFIFTHNLLLIHRLEKARQTTYDLY